MLRFNCINFMILFFPKSKWLTLVNNYSFSLGVKYVIYFYLYYFSINSHNSMKIS
jgi:hypothetical protein